MRTVRHVARETLLVTLLGAAGSAAAQDAPSKTEAPRMEVVVVEASRVADEQITQQAEAALANDPWIFSDHVTVTTHNGVIRVEGIVQDTSEWFRILRLCRKIPGARRVVSELEMLHNDPDGG
jgi:hypothetical protein